MDLRAIPGAYLGNLAAQAYHLSEQYVGGRFAEAGLGNPKLEDILAHVPKALDDVNPYLIMLSPLALATTIVGGALVYAAIRAVDTRT